MQTTRCRFSRTWLIKDCMSDAFPKAVQLNYIRLNESCVGAASVAGFVATRLYLLTGQPAGRRCKDRGANGVLANVFRQAHLCEEFVRAGAPGCVLKPPAFWRS